MPTSGRRFVIARSEQASVPAIRPPPGLHVISAGPGEYRLDHPGPQTVVPVDFAVVRRINTAVIDDHAAIADLRRIAPVHGKPDRSFAVNEHYLGAVSRDAVDGRLGLRRLCTEAKHGARPLPPKHDSEFSFMSSCDLFH